MSKDTEQLNAVVKLTEYRYTDSFNDDSKEFELVVDSLTQNTAELKPSSLWLDTDNSSE